MEEKNITISMEEYKELLIIKGKYQELKSQQIKPILYRETEPIIKEYGNNPLREIFTTDPLPEKPYKITCKE